MYAIIKTGGKQYRVAVGQEIDVEMIEGEIGQQVKFNEVLFFNNGNKPIVGVPHVPGCTVLGELIGYAAGDKVKSIKYIPGNHRKRIGHRQHYARVKITNIAS